MFHRVKSEMTDQDMDTLQMEDTQETTSAAPAQEKAEMAQKPVASSSMQKSLLEEEQAVEKSPEEQNEAQRAAQANKPQNVYQRVGASTVRPGVRYSAKPATPTYKAASPVAPSQARPSMDAQAGDRRLTIGRGITMSGEIESCDYLHVEGTVEAALKGATELNIAESGVFYGTVEIEEATIAGRFEGEIVVNGRLIIESTGVITGSISYRELEVQSGAIIDGRITPITTAKASATPKSSSSQHANAEDDLMIEAAE